MASSQPLATVTLAAEKKGQPEKSENSSRKNQLHEELRKTKICSYYKRGICVYGTKCNFAHSDVELQPQLNLHKTRICRNFQKGKCPDANCRFAHGTQELVPQTRADNPSMDFDEGVKHEVRREGHHYPATASTMCSFGIPVCPSESGSTTTADGESSGECDSAIDSSPARSRRTRLHSTSYSSESPTRTVRSPTRTVQIRDHAFAQAVKEELETLSLNFERKCERFSSPDASPLLSGSTMSLRTGDSRGGSIELNEVPPLGQLPPGLLAPTRNDGLVHVQAEVNTLRQQITTLVQQCNKVAAVAANAAPLAAPKEELLALESMVSAPEFTQYLRSMMGQCDKVSGGTAATFLGGEPSSLMGPPLSICAPPGLASPTPVPEPRFIYPAPTAGISC